MTSEKCTSAPKSYNKFVLHDKMVNRTVYRRNDVVFEISKKYNSINDNICLSSMAKKWFCGLGTLVG